MRLFIGFCGFVEKFIVDDFLKMFLELSIRQFKYSIILRNIALFSPLSNKLTNFDVTKES